MPLKPLVSTLINNYNYGRYLATAIESALRQTYENTEVIVVDDGSTDESCDIIARYGTRVSLIVKRNGGQASALNAGLAACRGEVICLLDSDDWWYENKIDVVMDTLAGVQVGAWAFLRHNLLTLHEWSDRNHSGTADAERLLPGVRGRSTVESIPGCDVLVQRRNAPSSALCIARDALKRMGPIHEESRFRVSADAFLYTHLPRHGLVISIANTLGRYRVHAANAYFSDHITEEHLQRIAATEMALLESLPDTVRYSDTLLRVAHMTSSPETPHLTALGPLYKRLRRIAGPGWRQAANLRTLTIALREILRTVA